MGNGNYVRDKADFYVNVLSPQGAGLICQDVLLAESGRATAFHIPHYDDPNSKIFPSGFGDKGEQKCIDNISTTKK